MVTRRRSPGGTVTRCGGGDRTPPRTARRPGVAQPCRAAAGADGLVTVRVTSAGFAEPTEASPARLQLQLAHGGGQGDVAGQARASEPVHREQPAQPGPPDADGDGAECREQRRRDR